MRLRVYFSGMQLFVPVTSTKPNSRVHVVMPKSLGHHAPEHHVPVFMVNDSHLKEGSEQEGQGWFIYSLDGRVLALGEGGADTRICPEVVNLRAATQLDVDPDVLEKNGKGKAVARVDLWGGRMSRVETGACWYWFSDTPRPYTHIAEWEIYHPANTIALKVKNWNDSGEVTLPTLYPWKDSDIVDVRVFHLPVTGLPLTEEEEHVPPLLSEPPHFGCYFTVLKGFGFEARPRFAAEPGKCASLPNECLKIDRSGASPYNCMLATINPSTGG